jgi:hypothetical protein
MLGGFILAKHAATLGSGLRSSFGFAKLQGLQPSVPQGHPPERLTSPGRRGDSILKSTSLLDQAEAAKVSSIEQCIVFQPSFPASNHAWRS